jgi:hypothetical protein
MQYIEKMHGLLDTSMLNPTYIWPELKRAGYGQSEDELLQAISENISRKIVYYAVIGMWEYGSAKSLPTLKKLAYYPNQDVRTTSVVSVGKIAGSKEAKFYGELLDDPKYKYKMYPMTILWEVGGPEALSAVIRFAERVLSGKKLEDDTTDPRYIKEYLDRYGDKSELKSVIQKLNKTIEDMSFVKGYAE